MFLGLRREPRASGCRSQPETIETLKTDARFIVTDLRSVAVQGLVAPDHLSAARGSQGAAALACTAPLLRQLRRADRHLAGRLAARLPAMSGYQHFPRTDPVVDHAGVRRRSMPARPLRRVSAPAFGSCLAGFIEPGETIEEAVRRETLEEAGIRCGRVRYFASQPWPFPSSLMIGCHAQAISSEITVDRDELEDARWFTRDEAAAMLVRRHPQGLITPPPSRSPITSSAHGWKMATTFSPDLQPQLASWSFAPASRSSTMSFGSTHLPKTGTKNRASGFSTIAQRRQHGQRAVAVIRLGGRARLASPLGGPPGRDLAGDAIMEDSNRTMSIVPPWCASTARTSSLSGDPDRSRRRTADRELSRSEALAKARCADPAALFRGRRRCC